MLKFVRHLFDTKGLWHAIERALEVIWRFAFGGRRLDRVTDLIETFFSSRDLRMTFFVSAGAVRRHRSRIERLRNLGHDIGSHGVFHSRMDLLSFDSQMTVLNESHRALQEAGFGIRGFRPPYLNYNQETRMALDSGPFRWTSGEVVFWSDGLENGDSIERLGPLYHFHHSERKLSLPGKRLGLLDIPVSAPDDEILYERYRLRETAPLKETWCQIFERVHGQGELFHVLFHPERFPHIHLAVDGLISHVQACNPSVWLTKLDDLAEWWNRRGSWSWERVGSGHVTLEIPVEATILLKEGHGSESASQAVMQTAGRESNPFLYKDYRPINSAENYPALTIGLSGHCPKELEAFLHREGFLVEYTDQPEEHSLYLDHADFSESDARALLCEIDTSEKSLLRIWRWPSGHQSAFCISADICAIDLRDFWERTRNF